MSYVLDGLLPEPVASLYQKLLAAGRFRLAEHPELADSAEMSELIDRGFARRRYVGEPVVVPIEPFRAVENSPAAPCTRSTGARSRTWSPPATPRRRTRPPHRWR